MRCLCTCTSRQRCASAHISECFRSDFFPLPDLEKAANPDEELPPTLTAEELFGEENKAGIPGTLHRISCVRATAGITGRNRITGLTYSIRHHVPGETRRSAGVWLPQVPSDVQDALFELLSAADDFKVYRHQTSCSCDDIRTCLDTSLQVLRRSCWMCWRPLGVRRVSMAQIRRRCQHLS